MGHYGSEMNDEIPKPLDPGPVDGPFETVIETMKEITTGGSLYVNVDFIDLLDRMGSKEETFKMLGELKDLLR